MYFTLQCIQGTTLCSVFFCPSEPTGVTQEGVNTGAVFSFPFFFFLKFPTHSCGACLHFYREKGPFSRPFPSSTMKKGEFVYSRGVQGFNWLPPLVGFAVCSSVL